MLTDDEDDINVTVIIIGFKGTNNDSKQISVQYINSYLKINLNPYYLEKRNRLYIVKLNSLFKIRLICLL